ncbi:MAG: hypothetical protein ACR2OH_07145 [Microthrixaceae bacterium]
MSETKTGGGVRRWAVCASITDELLNDLAMIGLGDGFSMAPVEQEINLPAMGEVRLRLALTVTGVRFDLRSDDGGRARVTVLGSGDVSVKGSDYEGDTIGEGALGMPEPPAPLPVELTALADPYFEFREDHTLSVGLDLNESELVSLDVDQAAELPDGVEPEAWAGVLQMTSMMFNMMGHELFAGLGDAVGSVGLDLGDDVGMVLADLGVDRGVADTSVGSGVLSIGLPATEQTVGRALPVPVAGRRLGVSLARSGVDQLADQLLSRVVGGMPLPFEVELDLGERRIGGGIRQPRIISERFPDLRSTMRTEVAVRLARGRLELAVKAAWLEWPSIVPSFVNAFNRRLGGLASIAPLQFKFPATVQVPLVPGSDDTLGVRVDDLRVSPDGVGLALALS